MPAHIRGWIETSDKPSEQTFETAPYRTEVVQKVPTRAVVASKARRSSRRRARAVI
jgi:hypothetical protein